jgi:hypothetical protein
MDLKKSCQTLLDKLTNYSHTVIGSAYAIATLVYHINSGKDIGPNFVTFSGYFYAFLLGHAGVYQKWPDPAVPAVSAAQPTDKKI